MSIFSKIKAIRPKRTMHNLSYASKLSLPFGRLVPIMCEKVVPGDKFFHSHEFLMRMAPFYGQVFQQYEVRTEYFFVPSRLLWKNFEMFLSDGIDGTDTTFVHPYLDYKYFLGENFGPSFNQQMKLVNTLFDYFNLPTEYNFNGTLHHFDPSNMGSDPLHIDALPFLAYLKIFMDYYADENLDYSTYVQMFINFEQQFNDGDQSAAIFSLFGNVNYNGTLPASPTLDDHHNFVSPFRRAYRKDYFTSALPWAQRGPVVAIPLNGSGDVKVYGNGVGQRYQGVGVQPSSTTGTDIEVTLFQYGKPIGISGFINEGGNNANGAFYGSQSISGNPNSQMNNISNGSASDKLTFKAVNINGTATITDLRTAIAVQNWLEKRARSGVRPKEQIMSSFGVRTKDFRLDRAELLQSTKDVISIGEVFTTAQDESLNFVPGLGVSTGTGTGRSQMFRHFFEEHGYVIGLLSVMPKAAYYQGIPRQFSELDKYDYYWPEFQHIGEQEILNKELCLRENDENQQVFGYTPRYAHYKTRTDQIHGNFRTNLNFMHAARVWNDAYPPDLNNEFVYYNEEDNDQLRVFNAVTPYSDAAPLYCDFYHNFKALRPMDYFGSPRFI